MKEKNCDEKIWNLLTNLLINVVREKNYHHSWNFIDSFMKIFRGIHEDQTSPWKLTWWINRKDHNNFFFFFFSDWNKVLNILLSLSGNSLISHSSLFSLCQIFWYSVSDHHLTLSGLIMNNKKYSNRGFGFNFHHLHMILPWIPSVDWLICSSLISLKIFNNQHKKHFIYSLHQLFDHHHHN